MPAALFRAVKRELTDAVKARAIEEEVIEQRAALLAPLASAGMTALALSHEISRESRFLERIGRRLRRLASKYSVSELSDMAEEFKAGRNRFDSLQELFAPLLSDADKAATDRLRVDVVVRQVISGMSALMPKVEFDLAGVPRDLRFPLGSHAEWNALLQNVLSECLELDAGCKR